MDRNSRSSKSNNINLTFVYRQYLKLKFLFREFSQTNREISRLVKGVKTSETTNRTLVRV